MIRKIKNSTCAMPAAVDGDTAEPENAGDDRDHQKNESPIQHCVLRSQRRPGTPSGCRAVLRKKQRATANRFLDNG